MTRRTRILAVAGTLLVLLLALLIVLPLLFQDRIAQRARTEVNRTLNARVDWRDAGLTFFRDFPNLTLRLDDLTAVGVGRFERDTLASIRHLGVALDLPSVLGSVLGGGKPIVVRSIELDQPRLSLIKLEDGTANWDITKKTPETQPQAESQSPMAMSLRRFEIRDAAVAFDNRQA
ncbi:MAG: AsmA family protein, partial [Gemmatimonadales bacterium]|nr:AsmA family protein [Gemmatimonadales bacterium]